MPKKHWLEKNFITFNAYVRIEEREGKLWLGCKINEKIEKKRVETFASENIKLDSE